MSYICDVGANIYRFTPIDIEVGEYLQLMREPKNPVCRHSIAIFRDGKKVGYVPKSIARLISKSVDNGAAYACRITGIKPAGRYTEIGIEIHLIQAQKLA